MPVCMCVCMYIPNKNRGASTDPNQITHTNPQGRRRFLVCYMPENIEWLIYYIDFKDFFLFAQGIVNA